jgi:hypothetical protein
MVFSTPPITALVIFSAYEMNVGKLTATLTFPILSLFNILRFPLVVLPRVSACSGWGAGRQSFGEET